MFWIICLRFREIIWKISWRRVMDWMLIIIRLIRIVRRSLSGINGNIFKKCIWGYVGRLMRRKMRLMGRNCFSLPSSALIRSLRKFWLMEKSILMLLIKGKRNFKKMWNLIVLVSRKWMKVRLCWKICG